MEKHELEQLFNRYLSGDYTPQDVDILLALFDLKDSSELEQLTELVMAYMVSPEYMDAEYEERINKITFQTAAYLTMLTGQEEIDKHLQEERTPKNRPIRKYFVPFSIAAALLVGVISYGIYYNLTSTEPQLTSRYGDDVAPGGNRATLTLADGSIIDLDSIATGTISDEGGITITKDSDGLLSYTVKSESPSQDAVSYNVIRTPMGGTYKILLPDRSTVWLNSGSSLRYPVGFGHERHVQLQGEAFFSIAKNKIQPFKVQTDNQTLQVTGTEFNVYAYPEEYNTVTTLVEGGVSISLEDGKSVTLNPGEQSIATMEGIAVKHVDTEVFTAWKDNLFLFHHVELVDIMKQLRRWYDIDIDLSTIPDESLFIEINRDVPLSEVIYLIEQATDLKFEIKERRLIIRR